jgi:uncharacterized membrane protein
MVALSPIDTRPDTLAPAIRRIGTADLMAALKGGWRDFREIRGDIPILGVVYPAVGFLTVALSVEHRLFPLLFPLIAGLALVGPAVASGFFELAKRREAGQETGWSHFFDPFRRASGPLVVLCLMLVVLFSAWLAAAWAIYGLAFGQLGPASPESFLRDSLTTTRGWTMIVAGDLVGWVFAAAALGVSVVSFPIVVDRRAGAFDAVAISLRACARNPGAVALWGLMIAGLLVLGCIPLFVGLAVVLPVLGYASWRLYRRMIDWSAP